MVRVSTASYTRCLPLIWISTHAHFGAFPPASFSQKYPVPATFYNPRGHPARWVQDRPWTPSRSNNSAGCFDAHIAFPSDRSSIACHIPFRHIVGFHLNTFVSQLFRLMYVCQPAWTDLLTLIHTSCRSLWARRSDRYPGLCSYLSMCNHRNEEYGLSLRIDSLSSATPAECPLCTCLIVTRIVRIHRPRVSTWYQLNRGFHATNHALHWHGRNLA